MELVFLGTGTSQGIPVIGCTCAVCTSTDPRDDRTRSSVLLRTSGRTLLIDGGPDMRQQLLRARVDQLDAVLLTHEHMDHIAGLDDLRAFNFQQEPPVPMHLHGSPETLSAVQRVFSYAFSGKRYPGIPEFVLHPVERSAFLAGGVEVVPIEVMHLHMPVLGFRVGPVTYITDAKTIEPAEKQRIEGSRVLVLNALRHQPHISHLNVEEALALIEELRPERAYLTHISHLMGRHADMVLPPGVELAYDGLVVDVDQ